MPDIRRRATRIKLFDAQQIAGSSGSVTSDIWNITQGQAFSLWTEALTSSASVGVTINMYPGLNGTGGDPVSDTLASSAAVGIVSGTDLDINEDIAKAISVTLTNTGLSAATISQSLLIY
jgi:hypothetical protein